MNNQAIEHTPKIHWLSVLPSLIFAFFGVLATASALMDLLSRNDRNPLQVLFVSMTVGFLFALPLALRVASNRRATYRVHNGRFTIAQGVTARMVIDIPVGRINDVTVRQNLVQRLANAGDIIISTGADSLNVIRNIAEPFEVREMILKKVV